MPVIGKPVELRRQTMNLRREVASEAQAMCSQGRSAHADLIGRLCRFRRDTIFAVSSWASFTLSAMKAGVGIAPLPTTLGDTEEVSAD